MFERLQRSVRINGLKNVVAHRVALSDREGELAFRVPKPGNTGTGRLLDDQPGAAPESTISVSAAKGDRFLGAVATVSAIKIDVEGAELRVLNGLGERIHTDRPLLVFEVLQGGEAVMSSFAEQVPDDYRMFLLKDIKQARYAVAPWRGEAGDVLAIPAADAKRFLGV
jgi:FkbM family methyltransferase